MGIKGTKTAKVLSNGFHTVEALNIGNEARKLIFENPDNNLQGINDKCKHHIKPLLFRLCLLIFFLVIIYLIFSYT